MTNMDQDKNCDDEIKESLTISVPYMGEIPHPLSPGRAIVVNGKVKLKATRLSINLQTGVDQRSNIAFHLNPRFDQNYVVRNSYIDGNWGDEEITAFQKNPFKRGEMFYLFILMTENTFMVAINGLHFCGFKYRLPLKFVNTLMVHGDLIVTAIKHRHVDIYPEACPLKPHLSVPIAMLNEQKDLLTVPFTGYMSEGGFKVGREIEITGRVMILPQSFYINLQSGCQFWPHPEVPLHLNPRFLLTGGTCVVRNSWLYNKWGEEESNCVHYFRPGREFTLKIICKKSEYVIETNGSLLARFKHRITPEVATTLHIHGDVRIFSIREGISSNPL